jgi:hypothetical protein
MKWLALTLLILATSCAKNPQAQEPAQANALEEGGDKGGGHAIEPASDEAETAESNEELAPVKPAVPGDENRERATSALDQLDPGATPTEKCKLAIRYTIDLVVEDPEKVLENRSERKKLADSVRKSMRRGLEKVVARCIEKASSVERVEVEAAIDCILASTSAYELFACDMSSLKK